MEERILEVVRSIRPDVDFEKETALIDNEILDSFDVIQIVTELMGEFGIFIDADDIEPENLNSLEGIREMVERKMEN